MNAVQLVSIAMELAIAGLALMIGFKKKKTYGYGLALTFGVYVFYDLVRLFEYSVPEQLLTGIFFVATASALFSVWMLYVGEPHCMDKGLAKSRLSEKDVNIIGHGLKKEIRKRFV